MGRGADGSVARVGTTRCSSTAWTSLAPVTREAAGARASLSRRPRVAAIGRQRLEPQASAGQGPSSDCATSSSRKEIRVDGLGCLEESSEPALRVIVGARQLDAGTQHLRGGPEMFFENPRAGGALARLVDSQLGLLVPRGPPGRPPLGAGPRRHRLRFRCTARRGPYRGNATAKPGAEAGARSIVRLEKRIRKETSRLVDQLLLRWRELAGGKGINEAGRLRQGEQRIHHAAGSASFVSVPVVPAR